jgi:hypothetical protein
LVLINYLIAPQAFSTYPGILFKAVDDTSSLTLGTEVENNINLFNFYPKLNNIINNNLVSLLVIFGISIAAVVCTIYYLSKSKDFDGAFSLSIIFTLVLNIHTLSYDYLFMLVPISLLFMGIKNYRSEFLKLLVLIILSVNMWMALMLLREWLVIQLVIFGFYLLYDVYRLKVDN